MPDRIDQSLLVAGLFTYLLGQVAINLFGSMNKDEILIDITHWLMLTGVTLMIPFAARLPRSGIALLAGPVFLIGVVLTIGMCVLDFVFWSLPDAALKNELATRLRGTPVVWGPFISYAGHFLTIGLALPSLVYARQSKLGTALVVLGALVIAVGPLLANPPGYALIIAGYLFCFNFLRRAKRDTST